jgi:hypothetical protein
VVASNGGLRDNVISGDNLVADARAERQSTLILVNMDF